MPAATSATVVPGPSASASVSHATAADGYVGRARSYAPASDPNPAAATSCTLTALDGGSYDAWEGVQPWRPHSSLPVPAHRPARGSSPAATGLVHGQQPIDG